MSALLICWNSFTWPDIVSLAQAVKPIMDGELFNEAEEAVQEAEEKGDDATVASHTRKRNRQTLPPHLPRKEVYLDIPEEEKVCPCGKKMHKMGEERSEKLTFIPAKVEVTVYIRPKYVCRNTEKQGESAEIKMARLPPSPSQRTSPPPHYWRKSSRLNTGIRSL